MMCYRDMTFCTGGAPVCEKFGTCHRALTEEVRSKAAKWWGAENAPIARYSEPEKLQCYVKPEETK